MVRPAECKQIRAMENITSSANGGGKKVHITIGMIKMSKADFITWSIEAWGKYIER